MSYLEQQDLIQFSRCFPQYTDTVMDPCFWRHLKFNLNYQFFQSNDVKTCLNYLSKHLQSIELIFDRLGKSFMDFDTLQEILKSVSLIKSLLINSKMNTSHVARFYYSFQLFEDPYFWTVTDVFLDNQQDQALILEYILKFFSATGKKIRSQNIKRKWLERVRKILRKIQFVNIQLDGTEDDLESFFSLFDLSECENIKHLVIQMGYSTEYRLIDQILKLKNLETLQILSSEIDLDYFFENYQRGNNIGITELILFSTEIKDSTLIKIAEK